MYDSTSIQNTQMGTKEEDAGNSALPLGQFRGVFRRSSSHQQGKNGTVTDQDQALLLAKPAFSLH